MFIFKTKPIEVTVESGEKVNPDGFENGEPYLRIATGPGGKVYFKRKTHCVITYPDGHRDAVLNDRVKDLLEGPFDKLFPVEESLEDKVQKAVAEALAKGKPAKGSKTGKASSKPDKPKIPQDE